MLGQALRRREFLRLFGVTAAWAVEVARPHGACAQPRKICRIGYLHPGSSALNRGWRGFIDGLKELGWVEGKDFVFEQRYADDHSERLTELAAELTNVDVIVTAGTLAPIAARKVTRSIPIVMGAAGDPVGSGLVATLARPGGNVTGLSTMSLELGRKRLELLKDILPTLARVAIVWNAANPYPAAVFQSTQQAASAMALELQSFPVRVPNDFEPALDAIARSQNQALIVVDDPLTSGQMSLTAEFAARNRLPAVSGFREFATVGGLMTYGVDLVDLWRRAAGYVDKICKGANPADLPVEQPTKFELIINQRAAKTLGVVVPPALLARADEVIE